MTPIGSVPMLSCVRKQVLLRPFPMCRISWRSAVAGMAQFWPYAVVQDATLFLFCAVTNYGAHRARSTFWQVAVENAKCRRLKLRKGVSLFGFCPSDPPHTF